MERGKNNLLIMPANPAARRRRRSPAKRVADLLDAVEEKLRGDGLRPTVTDFIRLLQIHDELKKQQPRDIEVTWIDPAVDQELDAA
jgi:hypothetical protein